MRTQNSLQVVGIPASPTALALNAQLFSRLLLDLRQRDAPEPRQVGWCVVLSHLTGKLDHLCAVVGPANDGAQGNGQDVQRFMALGARNTWVGHLPEVVHQAQGRFVGHAGFSTAGCFEAA